MNRPDMRSLTLFDLLARSWQRPAAITHLRFSGDGAAVAFACADGSVAIAPVADREPPEARIRVSADLGQSTIRPRAEPPAPLVTTTALADRAPALVGAGAGFLVGGGAGEVLRLNAEGGTAPAGLRLDGPVVAIDHAPATGAIAAADAERIVLTRSPGEALRLTGPGVAALAFSPEGNRLAAARNGGLAVWETGMPGTPRDFALGAPATAIRWRNDGAWLAAALGVHGLGLVEPGTGRTAAVGGFPAPVQSLGWSGPAAALVASGAFRIAAWADTALPLDGETAGALETGHAGLVVVEVVAPHPGRRLVAAGYANGQVVIAEIGGRDELMLRQAGGAVTALAWSRDGRHLAVGDAEGAAALVTFPPQMFK